MSGPFPKYWDKASWDAYEAERATRIMPIGPKALQIMREVLAEQGAGNMIKGMPHPRAGEIEALARGLVEGDNPDTVVTAGVYDAWDPYWSPAPVADSLKDGDFVPDIAVYVPLWCLKTREAAKRLG